MFFQRPNSRYFQNHYMEPEGRLSCRFSVLYGSIDVKDSVANLRIFSPPLRKNIFEKPKKKAVVLIYRILTICIDLMDLLYDMY